MAKDYIGKLIADKYKIESLIGHSETGEIYRAVHNVIGKPLTLMLLSPRFKGDPVATDIFIRSAKEAARPDLHPNILDAADFGEHNGEVYAVYNAANAESLRSSILNQQYLPVESSIEIINQTASALSSIHSEDKIHGNLTTGNILLSEIADGAVVVKIFDIGSANPVERGRMKDVADASEYAYAAPEVCSGEKADARSDIYSLGVILYESLAGVVPFIGQKPADVMLKHTEEPPAPLISFRNDLPPGLEPVILKAMAKDPDLRYQTVDEFINDLSVAVYPNRAAAASGTDRLSGGIWGTVALIAIGIAMLAGALIYATSVRQTDPETVEQPNYNGLPVQPINPATGVQEQNLASMTAFADDANNAEALDLPPDTIPGGDGYNPWATGNVPPGAPAYVPGGEMYTVGPGESQFMPPDGCILQPSGILLCPKPLTANTAPEQKPSPSPTPTPETLPANTVPANSAKPTPNANTASPKPSPSPAAKPPANKPPADKPTADKPVPDTGSENN